jgi:hypothetical protein
VNRVLREVDVRAPVLEVDGLHRKRT